MLGGPLETRDSLLAPETKAGRFDMTFSSSRTGPARYSPGKTLEKIAPLVAGSIIRRTIVESDPS